MMERKYWLALATVIAGAVIGGVLINSLVLMNTPEGFRETPPQASFNYTYDSGNETLTIAHTGGIEFTRTNTQQLELYVTERESPNMTKMQPTKTVSLPFKIGETVLVSNVESGDTAHLVWRDPGDKQGDRAIIAKHTIRGTETQ